MHYSVFYCWVLLPVLIVSALQLVSPLPRAGLPPAIDRFSASDSSFGAIQSLHLDQNSVQASFIVPCSGCIGGPEGPLDQSFLFNLEAFSSAQPCGSNNVSVNGIPLVQEWESTGVHGQGLASVNSSGHALNVFLTSDCVHRDEQDVVPEDQLLTFTVQKVDQESIQSLAGFAIWFKQSPEFELLRLTVTPDEGASPTTFGDIATTTEAPASTEEKLPLSLEEQVAELEQLEAQANELIRLIQEKRDLINAQFATNQDLKKEIKACESFLCIVKAIGRRMHDAAHAAFLKLHTSHQAYANWHSSAGGQAPAMMAADAGIAVAAPDACHCHDSRPKPTAPTYKAPLTAPSEKTPAYNSSQPQNSSQPHTEEPQWREASDPSIVLIVIKFVLVITGLAFLFKIIRKCCISDRKRVDRAAERERRATERLYKCAATKQSWRDWWSGRKRGKPGYRHGDYEEKRALILQQEHILEGAMQDEIQQLRIREEIRQLRHTRDIVDDLVRAEEGRSTLPRYTAAASSSSSSAHPFGFHPVPAPITIPTATSRMYPSHQDPDEPPGTPLSRTSSLPDYKTEASSEPPGYESDRHSRRSSFSNDGDGYSEYAHSIRTTDSQWSPDSSIPDLSPRPSMETAMTVETARTFL